MDFQSSLIEWKKAEDNILARTKLKYPLAYLEEWYYKEWDMFIPEKNIGVEIKYDMRLKQTGNFLFECTCDGKPSGISTTKAQWWVIVDIDFTAHYILLDDIFETICRNAIGIISFDWEINNWIPIPMTWYLVPKTILHHKII